MVVGDFSFERGVLELPTETLKLIDTQPGKEPRAVWGVVELGDRHYFQADKFVSAALRAITEIHDAYLSKIPWTNLLEGVAGEKRREIAELQTLFKAGPWKYLGWHQEPLYFLGQGFPFVRFEENVDLTFGSPQLYPFHPPQLGHPKISWTHYFPELPC